MDILEKDKTTIENYKAQYQDYQDEIKALKEEVRIKPQVIKDKKEQEQRKQSLEEDVEEYLIIKNEVEKIPKLKEEIDPLRLHVTNHNKEITTIEVEIKKLVHIPGERIKTKDTITSLSERYNNYILHINTANKLPDIATKRETAFKSLNETKSQSKHQGQLLADLKPKFDKEEFLRIEQEVNDTDQNIAVLKSQLDEKGMN
ncbi:hypothetical protein LCGC14_0894680, partial [marine sediment metagenome]